MKQNNIFCHYVVSDLLDHMEGISARPMFGGFGIYQDGLIFAIIADDTLYFKVDETNLPDFKKYGSKPFTYDILKPSLHSTKKKEKKQVVMTSYYELPSEIMESDPKVRSEWVKKAVEVSRRAPKKKKI